MTSKINIYNPITEKETKVDPYGRTAKNIYRIYIEDLKTDPASILPDNLTYNKGRFVKVSPVEDVKNVRRITYNQVRTAISKTDDDTMSYFKKVLSAYKGQTIKVVKRYSNVDYDYEFDDDKGTEIFRSIV
jgi:adenylate kinase family enzyme